MTATLVKGGRVEVRGFGAFSVKDYKAYVGRNPKTGEEVRVPPKRLPCGAPEPNCGKESTRASADNGSAQGRFLSHHGLTLKENPVDTLVGAE